MVTVESTNELKCYLVITDNTYSSETHFIDIIHYDEFIDIDKTRIMGLDHGPDHTQIRSFKEQIEEREINNNNHNNGLLVQISKKQY